MTNSERQDFEMAYCYGLNAVRTHPNELYGTYEKTLFSTHNSRDKHAHFPLYVRVGGEWYKWGSCRSGWYMELYKPYRELELLRLIDQLDTALDQIHEGEREIHQAP